MSVAAYLLGSAALGYLGLAGTMFAAQRRLLYNGAPVRPDPTAAGLPDLRVVATRSHDGLPLQHWYVPAPAGAPVVLAFHGNTGDIADRADKLRPLVDSGFGLLLAEYRGFGGNPGRPTEPDILRDSHGVLDWLAGQGVPLSRTAVYGESLGTGVAVALAAERPVGAVVLDAPFTSIAEVAQTHYWFLPARWLVRDRYDSLARIGRVVAPILIMHGGRDETIPPAMGKRLYEAAPTPKRWLFLENGGHVDLWDHGGDSAVVEFLRETLEGTGAGQSVGQDSGSLAPA